MQLHYYSIQWRFTPSSLPSLASINGHQQLLPHIRWKKDSVETVKKQPNQEEDSYYYVLHMYTHGKT